MFGHPLLFGQLVLIVGHDCLVTVVNDVRTSSLGVRWGKLGSTQFIQEVLVVNVTFPIFIIAENKAYILKKLKYKYHLVFYIAH